MSNNFIIETRELTKVYGEQTAVKNVNLHVEQGKIYGLLGRNGAGKTTIMKMMLGLTPVSSGCVNMMGKRLKGNERDIYPRIGAIIETPGFYPNLTGTENLKIFAKLRGMTRKDGVKHALEVVGLPYNDKKLFSNYSLGMKQRLGIANAIMHEPELLILDEPTNGLDPIGIAEVRKFLTNLCKEKGITILISSHILSEMEQLADTIGIIHQGILLEEISYSELKQKNRKYILLKINASSDAAYILEQKCGILDYEVEDDTTIRIYDTDINTFEINKTLINNSIEVFSLHMCNDSLEDYFKKITGGEGIA
jgi:bacitracin transport system ATP-binding protein